jgi:hypothetical protein
MSASRERRKKERRLRRLAKKEARRFASPDDESAEDEFDDDDEEHSHVVVFRRTRGALVRDDDFEPDPGEWSPGCAAEALAMRLDRAFFEENPGAGRYVRPLVVGECPGANGATHVVVVELVRGERRVRFAFRSEDGSGAVPPGVARDVARMAADILATQGACERRR